MRRWWSVLVLAGVAGLVLAGCGRPAGIDGLLVDDWAAMAEPLPFVPPIGVCHPGDLAKTAPLSSFNPVDCGSPHRIETVHVGTFTGVVAEQVGPPPEASPEIRAAFGECDGKAREYVGNEWRGGRLRLGVASPSPQAWTGGARWFRCDMAELSTIDEDGDVVSRTASLRNALASPSSLRLGCYSVQPGPARSRVAMSAVDCGREHNGEFVGVWQAPDIGYPTKDADWVRFYAECRKLLARYVRAPNDVNLQFRADVVVLPAGRAQWQDGNRGVRCYLWIGDRRISRSVQGAGIGALPMPGG
jgi:hypothetical protein